jgi:hypothetical protein
VSHGGTWQPPDPAGGLPMVDLEEAASQPPARRRSPGTVIAATVGGVAVAAAAIFGVSRVLSGGDSGGAPTPEQAGLDLLTAIENEDVLGAIDVLLPGERETLREPVTGMIDELRRLEVLSSDADASAVAGVDIVFEDERVEVAETNVDDIANLDIFATASATVDGEQLPIGDLLLDNIDSPLSELDADAPPEGGDSPLEITAVEEGGRWYLSLFHTIAEANRQAQVDPPDIPEEGLEPLGGDGPEDAVDAILTGLEQLDVATIVAALNPEEFQALQRYAPIFLESAQDSLDQSLEESGLTIEIADPEYTVSGSGDTRSLSFDYARVDLSADGESVTVELEDGCWRVVGPAEEVNSCELSANMPALEDTFEDPDAVQDLLTTFEEVFAGYEDPGFIVEQVDGQWYLSPFATLSEQLLAVMRALDRDEIELLQDEIGAVVEANGGDISIGGTMIDEDFATSETLPTPETVPTDGSVPTTIEDPAGVCYVESTGEAASVCFQELIDSGEIEPSSVPIYVRFPECGLADVFWSGDYTTLPDADFTAIIEETAPCFQQLVASGEVDEDDLPLELSHPECLDGRNWFTAIEDEEFSDAVFECAFG